MPDGLRGVAAETYLKAVHNALESATSAHSQNPFSLGSGSITPLPTLPMRDNEISPHPPDSAHSGNHSVGVGTSDNIVVDESLYSIIDRDADNVDEGFCERLSSIASEINTLCTTSFNIPLTTQECRIIALGFINSMKEYRSLTEGVLNEVETYVNAIKEIK